MGQALYRKYRSTSLPEVLGQTPITTALNQALQTGKISHAYLFTGPRGTGKTSIARIMAHAINDLPYSTEPHLDIIEIDAASNRRIDEIRDLRDKVYIAPTSAKYKIYIIDEVHMLTREAFNALLKTLEEPPAHVVFMLATTDVHKLPETIISRTQRYNFRPVDPDTVAKHLSDIAKRENIKADTEALRLLARHGGGSFRDSISLLDQLSNHGDRITVDNVHAQLGIPPDAAVQTVLDSLDGDNVSGPVQALQPLYDGGFQAPAIAWRLAELLRQRIIGQTAPNPAASLDLLKDLLEVPAAHDPEHYLELITMKAVMPAVRPAAQPVAAAKTAPLKPAIAVADPPAEVTGTDELAADEPEDQIKDETKSEAASKPLTTGGTITDTDWANVLATLKKQYNTLYGIVRMAHTDFSEPGKIILSFTFAFHQKRINDAKNRKLVTDTIAAVTGKQLDLVCKHDAAAKPRKPAAAAAPADDALQDISSVFGGGELL